jgi:Tfp pilus assembly protein PilO
LAYFLSAIENIGKASGVYLNDVKPQKVKDTDFYKIMLVEVKFQATSQTLAKFLYELENSPLLLKVSRLQVNYKGGDSSLLDGTIQVSKVSLL